MIRLSGLTNDSAFSYSMLSDIQCYGSTMIDWVMWITILNFPTLV